MELAKEIIEKIDAIKEKLSDKEYKDIADKLLNLSKINDQRYEITLFVYLPYLQVKSNYDDDDVKKLDHHVIEMKLQKIKIKTKLKKCSCTNCNYNTGECMYKEIYEGNSEPFVIFKPSLMNLLQSEINMHTYFDNDCECCGLTSIDIPDDTGNVYTVKLGGLDYVTCISKKLPSE